MKKILLVNTNTEQMPYPVPPIGLSLLASKIENEYNVCLYDGVSQGAKGLSETIKDFTPDLIGFSIRNVDNIDSTNPYFYIDEIKKDFIQQAREVTKVPFILGGSGFSLYPQEILDYLQCEFGIIGEGEKSFPEFIHAFFHNQSISEISGLITNNFKNEYQPLDSFEGFSKLDTRLNFNHYVQRGAYSIQTKRGCYHRCVYCTYPIIEGKNFRTREPEKIVDEIEGVINRIGPQMFEFVDSTFNDPVGYAEKICEAIIKRGIKSRFRTMGINPAHTSDELFSLMRQAGFVQIDITPDSASPVMIKNFKKNFTISQLIKAAELVKKHNFPAMWFFIVSGPGETLETLEETLNFIKQNIDPLNMVHITSGLRIFPNTELHRIAINQGVIKPENNLFKPVFYFSPEISQNVLNERLMAFAKENLNFVPASESKPSPEMMREAMIRRERDKLQEPMFKTLLRIRHDWVKEGRITIGI